MIVKAQCSEWDWFRVSQTTLHPAGYWALAHGPARAYAHQAGRLEELVLPSMIAQRQSVFRLPMFSALGALTIGNMVWLGLVLLVADWMLCSRSANALVPVRQHSGIDCHESFHLLFHLSVLFSMVNALVPMRQHSGIDCHEFFHLLFHLVDCHESFHLLFHMSVLHEHEAGPWQRYFLA